MQPTDPSDAHLADTAIELRALKAVAVVFLISFVSVFYSLAVAFGALAVAYVAYKFSYYSDRVGVFDAEGLPIRHRRLELAVGAVAVAIAGTLLAIEAVFPAEWDQGGFLSLPAVDFTSIDAILADPLVLVGWAVVLAPAVVISYAASQFRHRLLFGLDTPAAAVRATVWESLARLPIYLLWVGVLTTRPVYELWEPLVGVVADTVGLAPRAAGGFATVLGDSFGAVVAAGFAVPVAVIGAYLGLQRWKYADATVPEVFGYPGIAPPSRASHTANTVVPAAVYLLYAVATLRVFGIRPIGALSVVIGVVVAVVVGANVLGRTTTAVRRLSERLASTFDGVVIGVVAGIAVMLLVETLVGAGGRYAELAFAYPIAAVPLTHLGNRIAGTHALGDVTRLTDRIASDPETVDDAAVERLFVYSNAWDDDLRAAAIGGLADVVSHTPSRRDDALDVFARAATSENDDLVRAGFRGIAAVLEAEPSADTHERLIEAGCRESILDRLESDDSEIRGRATEAAARLLAVGLTIEESTARDPPDTSRVRGMIAAVEDAPDDERLASAVVDYLSAVWYRTGDDGGDWLAPVDDAAQLLLGGLLKIADRADADSRLRAVLAVTGRPVVVDDERFRVAVDALDADADAVRYLAASVVGSSLNTDGRSAAIDADRLLTLLEDSSPPVRRSGAATIGVFLRAAPDRAPAMLDRLVLHLQENREAPGVTEGEIIRALGSMDVERLVEHPDAASTIAEFVAGRGRSVAEPASDVLGSMLQAAPATVREEPVGAALEAGLEHPHAEVRLRCLEAVVAVVDNDVEDSRRFVGGLAANLGTEGEHGGLAALCLAELLDSYPEDGLDVLPELADGLDNLTSIHRQAVPFVVRGNTVSAVTADVLARVVPLDPERGTHLIPPLVDIAPSVEEATSESVFASLAELSAVEPAACRTAVEVAADAVDAGRVAVRQAASSVLANVAAHYPEAVEPYADRLVLATDDDSPRVREAALAALTSVCADSPTVIGPHVHRIIGLLDDDSAAVRERAADLIVTVAERDPALVEPAAETADRLRRLQRDPAVELDPGRLQDASVAIQTGTPVEDTGAGDTGDGDEEIWTPETADEMGASGDTNVFEPGEGGGEFDDTFDGEFDDTFDEPTPDTTDASDAEPSSDVEDLETAVEGGDSDEDSPADVESMDTVVGGDTGDEKSGEETATDDVESMDTVVGGDTGDEAGEQPSEDTDVESMDTVVEPADSDEDSPADVGSMDTVVDSTEDAQEASATDPESDVESMDTVIEPGTDPSEASDERTATDPDEGVEDMDTVIEPSGGAEESTPADDDAVEDLDTVIESPGGPDEDADADPETKGTSSERPSGESDDAVDDLETVIAPDEDDETDDENTDETS